MQQIKLESCRARVPVQLDPIVISIAQVCGDAEIAEYKGQKMAVFSVGEHQYHCAYGHTILEHLQRYDIVVWGPAAERVAKMARTGTVVRIVGQYAVDYCDKDDDLFMTDFILLEKIEFVYPKQPEENPKEVIQQITDQIIQNNSFRNLENRIPLLSYETMNFSSAKTP